MVHVVTYASFIETLQHTSSVYSVVESRDRCYMTQVAKDGNGSGSDWVESPCTQNQNPKSKPEPEPNTDSGGNP
jgi:hypothetical protein